jgi:hypothetical protein
MSPEPEGAPGGLPDLSDLRRGHITYFPVVPGRLEFAALVRKKILQDRPDVIAVELPGALERHYREALRRLPQISVLVYPAEDGEEQGFYVPIEPADPFTEAVRTGIEAGAEILFIEPDMGERPHLSDIFPDPYALRFVPLRQYVDSYRLHPQHRTDETEGWASAMAWRLQGTNPESSVLAVVSLNLLDSVLDAMEIPQESPPRRVRLVDLVNAHPDCLGEITIEYPYLQNCYERYRVMMGDEQIIDRPRVQMALLRDAELAYQQNTGEKIAHWQRLLIARYTRNLAMVSGDLTAHLFDIVAAARAIADDNYAWEVLEAAKRYPAQQAVSELETVSISAEEVFFRTKRMKIRRRLPRPKQRLAPRGLKEHKKEAQPGEWARELDGNAICSYPPEDLVVENYGTFLKEKARTILSQERARVEPFLTSLLDGVDVRETLRNWHQGKIYVRSLEKMASGVGAVVVVFDADADHRYHYCTTWLGEHQNESDMAFYATDPFEHLVGPGIGRAEYGGFLMTRPPRRMLDVWSDPDYDFAETKPERLLMAALDYAVQKYVVYVAARPPRSIYRSIAAHLNRQILYIPIGQLSPDKLKRIRVVHVLDGYNRREHAKDYIW